MCAESHFEMIHLDRIFLGGGLFLAFEEGCVEFLSTLYSVVEFGQALVCTQAIKKSLFPNSSVTFRKW